MLSLVEIIAARANHLRFNCIFMSSWIKLFRSVTFLMMKKREMMWLTFIRRARISLHACLIFCVQLLTQLRNVILSCSMFRWICSELMYISAFRVSMSIKNMLYTLHATYIEHDFYADFSLRLEKLLREFSHDRFTVQDEQDFSLLRFWQFTS